MWNLVLNVILNWLPDEFSWFLWKMSKAFLFLGQTTAITKTGKGTTPDSLMLLKQKSLYSRDHQLIFCVEFGCRNSKLGSGILHEIFFE